MEKAIELNPSYAAAYLLKAIWFVIHERFDEAIESIRKAILLDPFNPAGNYAYAAILLFSDQIKESSNQLDILFEISPHFPDALSMKGMVYQLMGEHEKAMNLYKQLQIIPGFEFAADGFLGRLYLNMNQPAKANEYLEKLLTAEKKMPTSKAAFLISLLYASMDKPDEMFHFLNKSVENKDNEVIYILVYLNFRKFRQDPRFVDLVRKIGLWK